MARLLKLDGMLARTMPRHKPPELLPRLRYRPLVH
jgi:hypothetical protein